MTIVIDQVVTDVVSRPATEMISSNGSSEGGEQKPMEFDEIRKRLERAFRLAARLAAD
jgi:hypothetical protein